MPLRIPQKERAGLWRPALISRTPTVLWWKFWLLGEYPLRGRRNLHEAPLVQGLGDLHRVGGRALEQVVAHDPHLQAARVCGVTSQTPDEDLVAPGARERGRVGVPGGVV